MIQAGSARLGRVWRVALFSTILLISTAALWADPPPPSELESKLSADLGTAMETGRIPGLAAAVAVDGRIAWLGGFGLADVSSGRRMTTETVLNVGSVSKLVTSSAVMQLVESGSLDLDADVNDHLSFPVRNPAAPDVPITARQLLTHTSSLNDSESYGASYACGDPEVALGDWLRGYLVPGGRFFGEESFLSTAPGTTFEYSNVGYGLLGYLVEEISGASFATVTRRHIFQPLGMTRTGWLLSEIDVASHATPYWLAGADEEPDPEEKALLPDREFEEGELVPFCLYSFYNYPDGLIRTTIRDLAAFVLATQPGSVPEPLLEAATREEIFRDQLAGAVETDGRTQGLGWRRMESQRFGTLWTHGGADPGVRAHVLHRPADGVTVIVMANRLVVAELTPVLEMLFEAAAGLAAAETDET